MPTAREPAPLSMNPCVQITLASRRRKATYTPISIGTPPDNPATTTPSSSEKDLRSKRNSSPQVSCSLAYGTEGLRFESLTGALGWQLRVSQLKAADAPSVGHGFSLNRTGDRMKITRLLAVLAALLSLNAVGAGAASAITVDQCQGQLMALRGHACSTGVVHQSEGRGRPGRKGGCWLREARRRQERRRRREAGRLPDHTERARHCPEAEGRSCRRTGAERRGAGRRRLHQRDRDRLGPVGCSPRVPHEGVRACAGSAGNHPENRSLVAGFFPGLGRPWSGEDR
jgi:hypothetical protein